jgi:hypothetical protein
MRDIAPALERDDFASNRRSALAVCVGTTVSENRHLLFRDHAPSAAVTVTAAFDFIPCNSAYYNL